MKKITLFILLFVTLHAGAQDFYFIPKVGLNLAKVVNWGENRIRAGFNLGFSGEVLFNERFAIEPGIYYSLQDGKYKVTTVYGDTDSRILHYMNIPIYAKAYIYRGFHVFAGPQFSFNIKPKDDWEPNDRHSDYEDIERYELGTFDISLGMGAGYLFDSGLLFSLNFNIGRTELNRSGIKSWSGNRVLQMNVGWRF